MADLKPCPFCGGSARLLVLRKGVNVMCTECDCQTRIENDCNPISGLSPWREGRINAVEKAIEAWNRRAKPKTAIDLHNKLIGSDSFRE